MGYFRAQGYFPEESKTSGTTNTSCFPIGEASPSFTGLVPLYFFVSDLLPKVVCLLV